MTNERAREIVSAMTKCVIYGHVGVGELDGIKRLLDWLRDVTLAEMVEANAIVSLDREISNVGGVRTLLTTCDDRVTAALYVWLNYDSSNEPILSFYGHAVAKVYVDPNEQET